MKRIGWVVFVLLAATVAAGAVYRAVGSKSTEIVIISTNDIHGAIDGMPALATLVDRYRRSEKNVLLVDAGDKWTGNPYVDLYPEPGKPVVDLMNCLGYELGTVGNHGYDHGPRVLDERIRDGRFRTVLANMRSDSSYLNALPAYALIDLDGVRLCFLGLIDNSRDGHPDGFPSNFAGLHFDDPLTSAADYRSLRDSCDVLIGLTHIGIESDSALAVEMPELDLILGGHSHTVIPAGRTINGVLVTQAGKSLRYAGITRLRFVRGRLVGRSNELVSLDTVTPDARVAAMVARYKDNPELHRAIGSVSVDMGKPALVNWMSDAMREAAQTDFAFCNWNGVRIDSLPAGDVTVADVYAMEPFGNAVCVVPMRLSDLRELIVNKFNEQGKEARAVDLCPSGMQYVIETGRDGRATGVRFRDDRGRELPYDGRLYRVAMSNYVADTYCFPQKGQGISAELLVADALRKSLGRHVPWIGSARPRVEIETKE